MDLRNAYYSVHLTRIFQCLKTYSIIRLLLKSVLRIRICMDPFHFGLPGPYTNPVISQSHRQITQKINQNYKDIISFNIIKYFY